MQWEPKNKTYEVENDHNGYNLMLLWGTEDCGKGRKKRKSKPGQFEPVFVIWFEKTKILFITILLVMNVHILGPREVAHQSPGSMGQVGGGNGWNVAFWVEIRCGVLSASKTTPLAGWRLRSSQSRGECEVEGGTHGGTLPCINKGKTCAVPSSHSVAR